MDIPGIGVWICDCAGLISDRVDTTLLAEKAQTLENVSLVKRVDILCHSRGLEQLKEELVSSRTVNRILLVGCSPRTSLKFPEERITDIMRSVDLSSDFFEVANVREQAAWLSESRDEATRCALDLMLMAHARLEGVQAGTKQVKIAQKSLVIGAGPAGLQAAKDLAALNQKVTLVERGSYLGGKMCQLPFLFQCEGWPAYCTSLCVGPVHAKDVILNPNVTVNTRAEVSNIVKKEGNFLTTIKKSPRFVNEDTCISCGKCAEICPESCFSVYNTGLFKRKAIDKDFERAVPDCYTIVDQACTRCGDCLEVCPTGAIDIEAEPQTETDTFGAVFLATGLDQYDLKDNPEYNAAAFSDVVSSIQFERILENGLKRPSDGKIPESVVFVQCAGSRASKEKKGTGVPYCSKTCCSITVKQAERLAMANQLVEITIIYYRDIRAYERALENFYRNVRDMGIDFVNGEVLAITGDEDGAMRVKVEAVISEDDELAGEITAEEATILDLEADLIVLAHAQIPERSSAQILKQLGVTCDQFGFPLENQPRIFRPGESFIDRVYVIGSSSGPKVVQHAVEQGGAVVTKALPTLLAGTKGTSKYHSVINVETCSLCRICETICPHGAITITATEAVSDPAFCQACGLCQSACPVHAARLVNLNDKQILDQARVAFSNLASGEPKLLALLCYWCSYAGADLSGVKGFKIPLNFRSIRLRCSSSVSTGLVMALFKTGVDGILIAGCPHKSCHHRWGNYLVDKRIALLKNLFRQLGLSEKRIRFEYIGVPQSELFVKTIESMTTSLRQLGPNPMVSFDRETENLAAM
ncbi:hydrogenase iron-sulfur subunit [candidate division CSSED10-310 bacterium]|uniref:Hydrogenase iron-sulfur subunit n=1 Tax=candidate division CSSED10-310 bacterium TaxID=2855610 RepID=A0ABV6YW07_UNCC1